MTTDDPENPKENGKKPKAPPNQERGLARPISLDVGHLNRPAIRTGEITSGNYWTELRVFLAVAKAKSFTKAAALLGASTATVSRRVRRLQDALKAELFLVRPHGVQLTPAGMDLAVLVARVDGMLADIVGTIGDTPEEPEGQVRIAITEGIATAMIASPLGGFSERYPKISVHLKNPQNINNLRENGADMMIALYGDDGPDVICRQLGTLHLVPMISQEYSNSRGAPTVETLHQHAFLACPSYSETNFFWKPWTDLTKTGMITHSCENSVTYFLLAKAGYGVALLSSFVLLDPQFRRVDLGVHIRIPLYGVALTESLSRPACRIAFDWLCDIYSPDNPWFQHHLSTEHAPSKYDATFKMLFNL